MCIRDRTRASVSSFNKRKDKYWFEKTSRKYSDDEIVNFLVSNFSNADNPQNLWIGEIINSGERVYTEWMKKNQSLTYLFKEQSNELFLENNLETLFDCSKGHPKILKEFLSGRLSLENFVIYNKIFRFSKNFDKKLSDPIWETVSLKVKKYDPFININVFKYKTILRNLVNE